MLLLLAEEKKTQQFSPAGILIVSCVDFPPPAHFSCLPHCVKSQGRTRLSTTSLSESSLLLLWHSVTGAKRSLLTEEKADRQLVCLGCFLSERLPRLNQDGASFKITLSAETVITILSWYTAPCSLVGYLTHQCCLQLMEALSKISIIPSQIKNAHTLMCLGEKKNSSVKLKLIFSLYKEKSKALYLLKECILPATFYNVVLIEDACHRPN